MAVLEDGLAQVEKEARKYSREDFEFGKILGEGSYSTVEMITLSNPYTNMFNVDMMNYILLCVCVYAEYFLFRIVSATRVVRLNLTIDTPTPVLEYL